MRKSGFFIFSSLIAAVLFLRVSFAQDYTRWGLSEGAKARLGKGYVTGDVTFSPDGALIAVASSIGIWLYDVDTGDEVNLLTGHTRPVSSVAFSPDGLTLASRASDYDETIRLWDVRSGDALQTLEGAGTIIMLWRSRPMD